MQENSYFSRKLTGGAISQRGFRYQTLVAIKYLMESMNDPSFIGIAVEQEDDFTLHFRDTLSVCCQVKSVLYDIGALRKYLHSESGSGHSRILICSGFSNEVQSLLDERAWYERRMKGNGFWSFDNKEELTEDYKAQLKKKKIDFDCFQSTKLDSIPVDYAETIARSAISTWVQRNKRSINAEDLFEVLHLEISRLNSLRGMIHRSEVLRIIDRCVENREDVYGYLGVMESNGSESGHLTPWDRWIYYTENRTADEVTICPSMHYWDNILQGKNPMTQISYIWEPFAWEFPNLDIKVLNNTNNTLYLTDIVVEVASSKLDPSPILYIKQPAFSSNKRHLALYNDGWGPLKNVSIQINSSPNKNTDFDHFGASENLGVIEQYLNIDLTQMLHTLTGIDFRGFDQAVQGSRGWDSADFYGHVMQNPEHTPELFRKYLGAYANGFAHVNGILKFDADTIEEQNKHYAIKFSAVVDLYDYSYCGVPAPPSYQYDIELRVCGESYTVRKPISQVLKPGEIDRFNVRIHCEKSARHIMDVCLMDITGRRIQVGKKIQLDMTVPRSGIQYIDRQNETESGIISGDSAICIDDFLGLF